LIILAPGAIVIKIYYTTIVYICGFTIKSKIFFRRQYSKMTVVDSIVPRLLEARYIRSSIAGYLLVTLGPPEEKTAKAHTSTVLGEKA
jgi:hypothetical protein